MTEETKKAIAILSSDAMDEFGRTESERTVVLDSVFADKINTEVGDGGHDTYVDALNYILTRGFAEIERSRASQAKAEAARKDAKALATLNDVLAKTPTLAANPQALLATLKALGALTSQVATVLKAFGVNAPTAEADKPKAA